MGHPILCPSASAEPGALLLGQVGASGVVAYAATPVRLTEELAAAFRATGQPERAFRFAQPCAAGGCAQWAGGRCGVADAVVDAPQAVALPADLPACLIRTECRWFRQRGAAACAICRYVVTDNAPRVTG